MEKTAVVYRSLYGSTRQYAQWIAAESGADLLDGKGLSPDALAPYDALLFGGGLYAGGISGIKLLTQNFDLLGGKRLGVFTVGIAPTDNPAAFEEALKKDFTPQMRERIRFFHLRGCLDYGKLGIKHRVMMAALKSVLQKKPEAERSQDDRSILETYGKRIDFTDRETIRPLVEFLCNRP